MVDLAYRVIACYQLPYNSVCQKLETVSSSTYSYFYAASLAVWGAGELTSVASPLHVLAADTHEVVERPGVPSQFTRFRGIAETLAEICLVWQQAWCHNYRYGSFTHEVQGVS